MPASTGTARRCWRLGRSLVGNADVVLAEVQCLKLGEAKHFCIVDAAMNDLMRPAMYQAWMAPPNLAVCERAHPPMTWEAIGSGCESDDWLGRERERAADLFAGEVTVPGIR